jgi:hypothetical protein
MAPAGCGVFDPAQVFTVSFGIRIDFPASVAATLQILQSRRDVIREDFCTVVA